MENKATMRKVVVRNSKVIAAMKESVASRASRHKRIVEHAKASGLLDELIEANKKRLAQ